MMLLCILEIHSRSHSYYTVLLDPYDIFIHDWALATQNQLSVSIFPITLKFASIIESHIWFYR